MTKVSLGITEITIVRDFLNLFLNELSGLPPYQEVDFEIETIPETVPISIVLY